MSITGFSQNTVIGTHLTTVPSGKKWTLQTMNSPIIEVSQGSLQSGNGCNAMIESNPRTIQAIVEGQKWTGTVNKFYYIHFKSLEKVHYSNTYTYKVSQILSFDCYDANTRQMTHPKAITFYQGQNVWVTKCLESIGFTESNLTTQDIAEQKRLANAPVVYKPIQIVDYREKSPINVEVKSKSLEYLSQYKDSLPFSVKLFDAKPLSEYLAKILDEEFESFKVNFTVQTPITVKNNILFAEGIAQHGGGSDEAAVAIEIVSGKIFIANQRNGTDLKLYLPQNSDKQPEQFANWYRDIGKQYETIYYNFESEEKDTTKEVEEMSSFPGGDYEMMSFIQRNLGYPDIAREKEIQGRVIIKFDVDIDGSLSDIKVLKSVSKELDDEALRIVKSFPKWQPAKINGIAKKSPHILPINFSLGN